LRKEDGTVGVFMEMACEEDELARMWEILVPEGKKA
jgi:hypothetical protein